MNIGGLGPTRLISPLRTLKSWGSSSRLVFRKNRPIRVKRGSFIILKAGPSISFKCHTFSRSFSASATIERNLYMIKRLPCLPILSWRNNIGPGESIFMRMGMTTHRGRQRKIRIADAIKSKRRFMNCIVGFWKTYLRNTIETPPRCSTKIFSSSSI